MNTLPMPHQITFAREVAARGLFGPVPQRGLQVEAELSPTSPVAVFRAYTPDGLSNRARLEVPVEDLRRLARVLLELADEVDRARGQHLRLAPVRLAPRHLDEPTDEAPLRRVG